MNKQKKPLYWYYIVILVVLLLVNMIIGPMFSNSHIREVTYSDFLDAIEEKEIQDVEVHDTEIYYTLKDDEETVYQTGAMQDAQLVDRLDEAGATFTKVQTEEMNPLLSYLITLFLPLLIFWGLGSFLFRRMQKKMGKDAMSFGGGGFGMGGLGKSNAKVYVPAQGGKTFKDVAGQDEAKEALKEIVDFLNHPDKYKDIGAQMPKGALLVGPPGTGKTLLAKAVAGEAGVPFFSISGSEFVEMFVGRGAAKVRDLFQQAREKAPCIVFIDEIDTIGKKRDGAGIAGNDEREQTLNQLLAEMDGFDGSKGVVILAATNRPESLDPALLRPGRFDRRIPVELPDLAGREAILRVHAKDVKCSPSIDFNAIARASAGASNDIEQATKLARSMITRLGMSDTFGMTALETVNNQYLGGDTSLACSAETAAKVDEEVVKLIRKAHDEAKELLKNNMGKLHELAKYLYDHETITGEEFMEILQKSE